MEVLSEKLIELESIELLTIDDIKGYIKQVENFAADYYHGSMSSMSKKDVAYRALNDVKKYADKTKASGSTRDMMECGILHTAVYHYKTALNSEELRAQIDLPVVDAVTHEIEAWQKLENTLCEYYAYSAFMQHQGGSLAQIGATGSTWSLAEARYNDTEMLQKAGFARRARNFPMVDDIRKKADETVKSLTATAKDLLDCDDDFKTSPYYNEVSKGLTAACENLSADMGAWINARISVVGCLEEQGIGIGETFKLLDNIIKIGSPEQ
ncbi:MAG: hypothetical protein J5629_11140 [Muribaculaceae bacterium]|nr:hypothetical protein [Muribaculaceae bacterium]